MASARKVPMPRSRGGSAGNTARSVPHPGTSGTTGGNFVSPFQPPPAVADLRADALAMDPDAWNVEHIGGYFWRLRTPTPSALGLLDEILDRKGGSQIKAINMFLVNQLHADDVVVLMERMINPDDAFGRDEYQQVYRAAVTVGTARPFSPCSSSPAQPPITGGRSVRSWP